MNIRVEKMDRKSFLKSVLLQREFLAVFIVIVNALSWYFPLYALFTNTVNGLQIEYRSLLAIFGIHYASVIGFAIIGIVVMNKLVSRNTLLSLWMFIGIVASLLMSTLGDNQVYLFLLAFVLGLSLGLGFPSCLAYFADYGVVEYRGRLGGFTYCIAGLGIFFIGVLTVIFTLIASITILAIWRGIGLIAFILIKPPQKSTKKEVDVSYRTILNERSFSLYLVPWMMFCLVNFLENPILRSFFGADFYYFVQIAEFGIGSVAALVGGLFSDLVGRKRIVIFGFVMLGIGYAVLGLFPNSIVSWYFYMAVDGVAWGILALMFFIILWGELAENRMKDKYYFLGVLPFLISSYIEIIAAPYVELVSVSASFSLASFFLFVSVLPLMYAPETLPEKKIELRRAKGYVEQAKKVREKYLKKGSGA